jgi:hypothetical protein
VKGSGVAGLVFGYTSSNLSPSSARRGSHQYPNSTTFGGTTSDSNDTANQNEARTKFAKKVEGTMTQFSGGVFLAELKETLHLIRNPAKALRQQLSDYIHLCQRNVGKWKALGHVRGRNKIQNAWLEASFGWLPLLHDLDDARSYLDKRQDALYREVIRVNGFAERSWLVSDALQGNGNGIVGVFYRERVRRNSVCVLSGGVRSDASSKKLIDASAMGLAPRSFVPTLWEWLPWSFAVDYFSNVGDVITAWSNQSCELAWGRETVVRESVKDLYAQGVYSTSTLYGSRQTLIPGDLTLTRREFSRTKIVTPPVPTLMYELPGFSLKWLNLSALLLRTRHP